MLIPVADGVFVHTSSFCQSNTVIVDGPSGVLLIDPGIRESELACLATDLRESDRRVALGFSTHPHWDHLLWHPLFGTAPRYATAWCARSASARLADPEFAARVAAMIPPEIVGEVSLESLGQVIGLSIDSEQIPWDGPLVRIIEHRAHAPGHAALFIKEPGVLVAGDTLSDIMIPILELPAEDPVGDYLAALDLINSVADTVKVIVPGHGAVGDAGAVRHRIDQDRAYLRALAGSEPVTDARIGRTGPYDWMSDLHQRQRQHLDAKVTANSPHWDAAHYEPTE